MNELLKLLYAHMLNAYGTRADIRIDCSRFGWVDVYINHKGYPVVEIMESSLSEYLEKNAPPPAVPAPAVRPHRAGRDRRADFRGEERRRS